MVDIMGRRLKVNFRSSDGDPSPLAWMLASVSLILPFIGIGLALAGFGQLFRGDGGGNGWWLVGAGAATLAADLVIDFIWANPSVSVTDEPALNRRGEQLVGRTALVVEAIEDGRGRVRVGDGEWAAQGPDCKAGDAVAIVGVNQALLVVEPVLAGSAQALAGGPQ
ncbi:MAG: NfeD family protein [Hyphomicrobiaceae bacterium]